MPSPSQTPSWRPSAKRSANCTACSTSSTPDWRQAADLYRETFGTLQFIDDQSVTPDAIEIQTIPI